MRSLHHMAGRNESASSPRFVFGVAWAAALAGCTAIALAIVLRQLLALDGFFPWRVLLLAVLGGSALSMLAAKYGFAGTFGAANRVTLARGALTMLLFALLGGATHAAAAWLIVAIAITGLILDGLDGSLARRRGETSAFGARFDMETDALLILGMTVLAWQFDKAGAWIVLGGVLRYLFVLAGYGAAWLRCALPSSRRRQTICVVQIVSLVLCLLPPVTPPASSAIALAGLMLLIASFTIDVVWLARRGRRDRHVAATDNE